MRKLLFLLLWLWCQFIWANEEMALLPERLHYASGEIVRGLLAFPKNENLIGKVLCYKILDQNNTEYSNAYIRIKDPSLVAYSYALPFKTPTGAFRIQFYYGQGNQAKLLIQGGFWVQNVFDEKVPNTHVDLQLSFTNFHKSGTHAPPQNAHLINVSTSDIDGLGQQYGIFKSAIDVTQITLWDDKLFVFGALKYVSEVRKINILGAYSAGLDKFLLTQTNNTGGFYFNLPDFEGEQSFQLFPYYKDIVDIEYQPKSDAQIWQNEPSSEYETKFLEKSQKILLLHTYFNDSVQSYFPKKQLPISQPTGYKRIDPKAYTKFERVHNLFSEVEAFLKFKESNGKWTAFFQFPELLVKAYDVNQDAPIFIVDGKATQDANSIATMKLKEIESIDLFFDVDKAKLNYPLFSQQGIIKIMTKSKPDLLTTKEKSRRFTINGLQYLPSSYQISKNTVGFSSYWNPEVNPSKSLDIQEKKKKIGDFPQSTIELYHSKELGFFVLKK